MILRRSSLATILVLAFAVVASSGYYISTHRVSAVVKTPDGTSAARDDTLPAESSTEPPPDSPDSESIKTATQDDVYGLVTLARNLSIDRCIREIDELISDTQPNSSRLSEAAKTKLIVHESAAMGTITNEIYLKKVLDHFPPATGYMEGCRNYVTGLQPLLESAKEDIRQALELGGNNSELLCMSAKALIEEGELEPAIRQLNQAIRTKPDDAVALALRARALRLDGNEAASRRDLIAAERLGSDDAEYWQLRAGGHDWSTPSGIAAGANDYRRALDNAPERVSLYASLGEALQRLGKLDEAEAAYRAGLKRDPRNPALYFELGSLYEEAGKEGEAIGTWIMASRVDPRLREAWFVVSTVQNWTIMKDQMEQLVELWPNYLPAHERMFLAANQLDDYKAALAATTRCIELDAANPSRYYFRAVIQNNFRHYDEALADTKEGLEIDPQEVSLLTLQGNIYSTLGDRLSALESLSNAILIAPDDFDARLSRADVYLELKQFEEAAADAERGVKIAPTNPGALAMSGLCQIALGNITQGELRFQEALRLAPEADSRRATILYMYGDAWITAGKPERAEEFYVRAKQLLSSTDDGSNANRISTSLRELGAKLSVNADSGLVTAVDFRGLRVSDDFVASLAELPGLTSISLRESSFSQIGLTHLGKVSALRHLDLRDAKVGNSGLAEISTLENLQTLQLSGKNGSDDSDDFGMRHIAKLTNLRALALDYLWVTGEGLSRLTPLTNLEELSLGHTLINDAELETVAFVFTKLKKLCLCQTQISNAGLKHVGKIKSLTELDISENPEVNDEGLASISNLTQLTSLNLWRVPITDRGLNNLDGMSRLSWLNLDSTLVSDDGLASIAELNNLQYLSLDGTNISDQGLEVLAAMSSLVDLKLTRTRVTQKGAERLQEMLPKTRIKF